MATTMTFFAQQSFKAAGSPHVFTGPLPQGITTVDMQLDVIGTTTPSPDGGTFPAINGSISAAFFDSADGVTWRSRGNASFVNTGGTSFLHFAACQPQVKVTVSVVGGPITADVSGALS